MFMLLVAVPALLTVWALAGRPAAFLDHPWRGLSLIWAALAAQVVLFSPLGQGIPDAAVPYAHVATYMPLLAFLVINRGAALGLVAVGVTLNVVAIVANGGFMPGDPAAQDVFFADRGVITHALNVDNVSPRFLLLGDVMALPAWAPFANAFSIGDLVMALGLVWAMARLSLNRLDRPPLVAATTVRFRTFAAPLAGWVALGVAFALIPQSGTREVAGILAVGLMVRWACLHRRLSGFARSRGLLAVAAVLLAVAMATAATTGTGAALIVATAAGALSTRTAVTSHRDVFTSDWGVASVLPFLLSAGGIATGAALGRLVPGWAGIAIAAVLALSILLVDRGVAADHDDSERIPVPHRSLGARVVAPAVGATAGFASVAGFVVIAHQTGLPAAGFGLLLAAWVMGVLFGVKMAATLAVPPTAAALGLGPVFGGAAGVLLATAHLPMTAIAAATVLGIATGAGCCVSRSVADGRSGWVGRAALLGGLVAASAGAATVVVDALLWVSVAWCLVGLGLVGTRLVATRPSLDTRVASG